MTKREDRQARRDARGPWLLRNMSFEMSPEAKQRMRDERRSNRIVFGVSALAITGMVTAIVIDQRKGSSARYPSYPFYVVDKATGQVLSGWEYREDAKDALEDSHGDRRKASMSVMTAGGLRRKHGKVSWARRSR